MFLLASSSESRLRAQNIRVLTVFSRASLANFRPPHSIRDFRQWKIALRFKSTKQPPDMRNADADGAQFGIQACQWRESVPPKKAFRHIPLTAPRPSYTTCRCPRKRQRTARGRRHISGAGRWYIPDSADLGRGQVQRESHMIRALLAVV